MVRIIVIPERLLDLSRQIGQEAAQLREMEGRLGRALGGLDWAVRQQANVEGQVHDARNQARALAERAEGMARFLVDRAQTFQQADQEAYAGWDSFFMPFRIPTPVPTPTPESGDRTTPHLSPEFLESLSTFLPPFALTALIALMKVDASGVGHVFGPQWLKELAGVSTHLTRIRPENLAGHLLHEDLFRMSFSPLANFMTALGLIPTAIEDWKKYSGQGVTVFAGAFLVDATIDIVLSKAFQLGSAALSTALLAPILGPLAPFAPAVGLTVGSLVGDWVADFVRGTSLRDGMVKTTTKGLEVIGGALRETAEGVQNSLSGVFDQVIVPME